MAEVTATRSAGGGEKKNGCDLDSRVESRKQEEDVSKKKKNSREHSEKEKCASRQEKPHSYPGVSAANMSANATNLDSEADQPQHRRDMKSSSSSKKSSMKKGGDSGECRGANSKEVLASKGKQTSSKEKDLGSIDDCVSTRSEAVFQKGSDVDRTKQKLSDKTSAKSKPKPQQKQSRINTLSTKGKKPFETANPKGVGTRDVTKENKKTAPQEVAKRSSIFKESSSVSISGTKVKNEESSVAIAKKTKQEAAKKERSKTGTVEKVKQNGTKGKKEELLVTRAKVAKQEAAKKEGSKTGTAEKVKRNGTKGNIEELLATRAKHAKQETSKKETSKAGTVAKENKNGTKGKKEEPSVAGAEDAKQETSKKEGSKTGTFEKAKKNETKGKKEELSATRAKVAKQEAGKKEGSKAVTVGKAKKNETKGNKEELSATRAKHAKQETSKKETSKAGTVAKENKNGTKGKKEKPSVAGAEDAKQETSKKEGSKAGTVEKAKKNETKGKKEELSATRAKVAKQEAGKKEGSKAGTVGKAKKNETKGKKEELSATRAKHAKQETSKKETSKAGTVAKENKNGTKGNREELSVDRAKDAKQETSKKEGSKARSAEKAKKNETKGKKEEPSVDRGNVESKEELERQPAGIPQNRDGIEQTKDKNEVNRFRRQLNQDAEPPDDYRKIQICPTVSEVTTREKPFLRSNIKQGNYDSPEQYLDVQFRLFREDFVAPLREGIREVTSQVPREKRNQNIKLYTDVHILSKKYSRSGITHKIEFDVSRFRQTNWAVSKRLIYGSFLCISRDNFKSMMFATVVDRDLPELRKGRVEIKFIEGQDVAGIENRNERFTIAESPAFFESYRHVLVGLQALTEENLPFKKYLVECRSDVDPPLYLCRRGENPKPVMYQIDKSLGLRTEQPDVEASHPSLEKRERRRMKTHPKLQLQVPVLKTDAWPSADKFPLNASQLEAIQTALTTEFSVIQGPPGTGKTYIGLKIVETLIDNWRCWNLNRSSPMLMVCYTNHALDQFLEGVLEFLPRGLIRVGGRSKSEKLENFNLKKFVRYRECGPIYDEMKL